MNTPRKDRPFKIVKPQQIESLAPDQTVAALLRLAMEISVLRDRLKTQEQLLVDNNIIEANAVDRYVPDADETTNRTRANGQLIKALIDDLLGE